VKCINQKLPIEITDDDDLIREASGESSGDYDCTEASGEPPESTTEKHQPTVKQETQTNSARKLRRRFFGGSGLLYKIWPLN